ncbi:MAG TPA: efflux RND transporter periplasmic adaptor subunit [Longimicrobiales bacterium]|nr:efflux RND transporter periplasmic adaptor subunit [Longimicrobiales bacterium]
MMNKKTLLVGAALAASLAAAACTAGGEAKEPRAPQAPVAVVTPEDLATARREPIGTGVVLTGNLNPFRTVEIRAQVAGLVSRLAVDRGAAVRAGQTLASIEAEGIRSQAAGAQAGVAAAQANLAVAQKQLDSARRLYQAGAMSEMEARTAEAQYEAARAQLASARAQASGAAEAAGHTVVTAPIAGEVSDRKVSAGEAVTPGQALLTVVSTDQLELAGQVPVEEVAAVRPGQPVEFTLDAYPGRTFRGSVARVEPTADPATRQVGVYVRLPNPKHELVGGVFATGRILTGGQRMAVVVPATAVQGTGADATVRVVRNGVVASQSVVVGAKDDARGTVEIKEGLTGGEQVLAAPGEVSDGARVRVAAESGAAAASPEGR